jgi:predicted DsbA family dithiol-disulfide isomerase
MIITATTATTIRYFTEGKRLADHEVLLNAVEEVGMDVASARAILSSETHRSTCLRSAADLQKSGIRQIPVFFFRSGDFEATVHGSSDVPDFLEVFRQAEAFWKKRDGLETAS